MKPLNQNLTSLMGNATAINDDEEEEACELQFMEFSHVDSMNHSPTHNPRPYQSPLFSNPQFPVAPSIRPNVGMRVPNQAQQQNRSGYEDDPRRSRTEAMITWSHGGHQVSVFGTWDNWETVEPLHSLGKDFIITKVLPPGIYHYRFIVDEQLMCAPDSPWKYDDSGIAYNILYLQGESSRTVYVGDHRAPKPVTHLTTDIYFHTEEQAPEAPENLVDFESPPSPLSSYNNEPLNDDDFTKAPPDLPLLLQMTPLNEQSAAIFSQQSLPRPQHSVLNHLYIQNSSDGHQTAALGSTHRFRQKYVTLVVYMPSRR